MRSAWHLLGILLTGGVILISLKLFHIKELPDYSKKGLILMNILVLLQILIGMGLQFGGISPLLQVFHLWLASILIGLILVMYTALSYKEAVE